MEVLVKQQETGNLLKKLNSLKDLENDETFIDSIRKPVAIFKTHEYSPRVLISNSCWSLIGQLGIILEN